MYVYNVNVNVFRHEYISKQTHTDTEGSVIKNINGS